MVKVNIACHVGSSPLTRGKQGGNMSVTSRLGLIPAHAGKTCRATPPTRSTTAHPRSRGENKLLRPLSQAVSGSSPLTRGKPHVNTNTKSIHRLIPAHAGKTACPTCSLPVSWAHPRSRGENGGRAMTTIGSLGSSPLTRGKPEVWVRRIEGRGLIPAHAGKTRRFDPW